MRPIIKLIVYIGEGQEGSLYVEMKDSEYSDAVELTVAGLIELGKVNMNRANILVSYFASVSENMKTIFPEIAAQVRRQNIENAKNQNSKK
jgi:hypothetical protein